MGKKSFVFFSGTGGDFGGNDGPIRSNRGSERRQQTEETPQTVVASPVNPNPSTEFQNIATPEIQAPNSPTSHAGNDVDGLESFPIVLPRNMHTKTINFDDHI